MGDRRGGDLRGGGERARDLYGGVGDLKIINIACPYVLQSMDVKRFYQFPVYSQLLLGPKHINLNKSCFLLNFISK
jgi:hypothetical protein